MIKALKIVAICFLTLLSSAQAEQFKKLGKWDVHYMVINTSFLTPEVARDYGLQRSKYQGLVNISVLDSITKEAQNVDVSGAAVNLIGTNKKLEFKMVQEGDAIYYLAVLPFRHKEKYRFEIDVRHGNDSETLKFEHEFYSE